MITRDKGSGCDSGPLAVPKLATPRISRLVDGFKAVQESNRVQALETQKLYSKRWQKVLDELKRAVQ